MYSVFLWSVSRLPSLLNNESGSSRSCPNLVLSDKRLYSFLYYNRAIFNSVSKVIQDCFGFALFRYRIGPENLRHFLDQPDSKVWTIATWSLAFSRASGSSRDFTSSSYWLLTIFSWLLWLLGFSKSFLRWKNLTFSSLEMLLTRVTSLTLPFFCSSLMSIMWDEPCLPDSLSAKKISVTIN